MQARRSHLICRLSRAEKAANLGGASPSQRESRLFTPGRQRRWARGYIANTQHLVSQILWRWQFPSDGFSSARPSRCPSAFAFAHQQPAPAP